MTSEGYLSKLGAGITIRVIDALGAFRILKLCRYFEGSMILALAVGKSLKQLLVPLFMLLLMVFCFAAVVFEIEFDGTINDCVGKWVETTKGNVSTGFIKANRDGVTWDCSVCGMDAECQPGDSGCVSDYEMKCLTCNGYPAGHPECAGVVWGQTFEDIPRSMWFMFVTVSTVGYGDVSPGTWQGQIFVCMVIICGLIFLAMPLAIVGSTFGQVWDERQLIKLQMHLRQLLAENGINPDEAVVAFKKIDSSGDGTVAFEEFKAFTTEFNFELADEEIKEVWKSLDADGSGSMTLEEFITKAYPGIDLATVEGLFPMSEDPLEKLKQQRAQDEKAQIKQRHNEIISAISEQKQAQVRQHRASSICSALTTHPSSICSALTTHPTHHYHPTPSLALSLARSKRWIRDCCKWSKCCQNWWREARRHDRTLGIGESGRRPDRRQPPGMEDRMGRAMSARRRCWSSGGRATRGARCRERIRSRRMRGPTIALVVRVSRVTSRAAMCRRGGRA